MRLALLGSHLLPSILNFYFLLISFTLRPLHGALLCTRSTQLAVIKTLLSYGADPSIVRSTHKNARSVIHVAETADWLKDHRVLAALKAAAVRQRGTNVNTGHAESQNLRVGQRVALARGQLGTGEISFIGNIQGLEGVWVGVTLDELRGKHDGCFRGQR